MTLETAEHAPARLQLDADTATVLAGGLSTLHGLIRGPSSAADTYDFRVTGLPEPWVGLPPAAYAAAGRSPRSSASSWR